MCFKYLYMYIIFMGGIVAYFGLHGTGLWVNGPGFPAQDHCHCVVFLQGI